MTEKRVKSVRLPADVAESVEQLSDDRDVSESDMLRRLVERGLRDDRLDDLAEQVDRAAKEQTDRLDNVAESVEQIEQEVSKPVWQRLW